MSRYRITIEYDGTPFAGWQLQPEHPSVQGALQDAIFSFSSQRVVVKGAGRTDAGVHAIGQVAHFDISRAWEPFRVREAINFHLKPLPVAVISCELAAADFDARFSATARHYRYRILCRRAPPVLDRNRVWWLTGHLDAQAMGRAAGILLGHHDFTTFRAAQCQARSPVKTLDRLDVRRQGEEVVIEASARSFLHSQVRSMVGSLKLVGAGDWSAEDLRAALDAKDRTRCGTVAPAAGLYLVGVDYAGLDEVRAGNGTDGD